jgi:MraZ protein
MPTISENEPIFYTSTYHHGVDEKRRLQIPAKWRPPDIDVHFTLIPWPKGIYREACLLVLPPEEWNALAGKLKTMPFADPKAEALRRLLGGKADRVSLDKAGRICLPEKMAKAVGIESEVVLVGLVDRFEIWSPERYQSANAVDEELAPEAFKLI